MGEKQLHITLSWDDEAKVWYVSDSDVPGLSTWGATIDEIIGKVEVMVPELLELNAHLLDDGSGNGHGLWFRRLSSPNHHVA